jgi:hypothetical protein
MERLATWWHPYDPKHAPKGMDPTFIQNWVFCYALGFYLIIMPVLMDFLHFWEILGIFGAQILGGSWRWITNFRSIKTRPD